MLTSRTSGLALAAAVTALFNTALAWAKDSSPSLTHFMTSLTGHHWTSHGLADLVVFAVLGVVFTQTKAAQKIDPARLANILIGAVVVASLGLVLWFAFV